MEEFKSLGYLLGRSLRVFKSQVTEEVKNMDFELSLEQYVILYMINSSCDLIQQDLARQFA